MNIKVGERLSKRQVIDLLSYFDDSSDIPLHKGLDFDSYSEKLSEFALFTLAYEGSRCFGFVAYYLNQEGKFVYIPQIVVHKNGRHKRLGHQLLSAMVETYSCAYTEIQLEVLKINQTARYFYERENFVEIEDRGERVLMCKII